MGHPFLSSCGLYARLHNRARSVCEDEGRIRQARRPDDWAGMVHATIFKHTLTDIRDSQSADPVDSHNKWIADVNEVGCTSIKFPIIADADRHIACLYDMIAEENLKNPETAFTIRSVFIIDPNKKIRLMMLYPASTGRNTAEVLRVIDSLQTGDKNGVVTPMDWKVGDDVIVPPSVSTEDARKKFGEVREVKPYLRFAQV